MTNTLDAQNYDPIDFSALGEARFRTNIAALDAAIPGEGERYLAHEPSQWGLGLHRGFASLIGPDGKSLYDEDPSQIAKRQVAHFVSSPPFFTCTGKQVSVLQEETVVHSTNSNRAIGRLLQVERETPQELPQFVNLLLVLGCGLGYHLDQLLSVTEVRHLIVVEPEPDVFYASLHTFDWAGLIARQAQPGFSLELVIGGVREQWGEQLIEYAKEIGVFNLVQPYVFQHFESEGTRAAVQAFTSEVMPTVTSNLGYFDDEQVGLAHTLLNIKSGIPTLSRETVRKTKFPPVFLVANGPSLDGAIETIREQRDGALVISCGTAFGSLSRAGIRPDLHLEIERDREISEWLSAATTEEDRAGPHMLGLNVVHPDVFNLFRKRGLVLKANDMGAQFLQDLATEPVFRLGDANPNVANFAMAIAGALGAPDVYMFGTDLGFPRGDLHHSTLSPHYQIREEEEESVEIHRADDEGSTQRPGNFGGWVRTLDVFVQSAFAMERVVSRYPRTRYHNTGEGIAIEGTRALRVSEIRMGGGRVNAEEILTDLFAEMKARPLRGPHEADLLLLQERTLEAIDALAAVAEEEPINIEEGMVRLMVLHLTLAELGGGPRGRQVFDLLRGSLGMFSLTLAQALHRVDDEDRALALHSLCNSDFLAFLSGARTKVEEALLRDDRRVRNVAQKLKSA